MRARALPICVLLIALLALIIPVVRSRHGASAATPPGWVRIIVPGIAGDSAPAPTAPPSATGNRGLRIYVELEMFNEDRVQTLVGDIRLPNFPPVFSQPIKVKGKYRVDDGPSNSNCTWTQKHTDAEFGATIYWSPEPGEVFVEFDWPHWEDWADCPHNDEPILVARQYPIEFHATQAFQEYRDPTFFFHYRIPLEPTPSSTVTTHRTNRTLIGDHTRAHLEIDFCRGDNIAPLCDWPLFNAP